jgi:hypothetical protein
MVGGLGVITAIHRDRIFFADHDADAIIWRRPRVAAQQRCKRRDGFRLGDDARAVFDRRRASSSRR